MFSEGFKKLLLVFDCLRKGVQRALEGRPLAQCRDADVKMGLRYIVLDDLV